MEGSHILLPDLKVAVQVLMPGDSFFEHLHARHVLRNGGFATVAVRGRRWPSGWKAQAVHLDQRLRTLQF